MKKLFPLLLIVLSNMINAQDIVRIAAHNSTEQAKACADYICAGKNDEATIQKVLDLFAKSPDVGHCILLSDGTYHIGGFYSDENFLQPTAIRIGVIRSLVIRGESECPRNPNGVVWLVDSTAYDNHDAETQVSVLSFSYKNPLNYNRFSMKNINITLPDIRHKVIAINTYNTGSAILDNLALRCEGSGPGCVPVEGLIGVRGSSINPNGVGHHWTDIVSWGFHEGFQIGGEHIIAQELLALKCYYGFTFGNYDMIDAKTMGERAGGVWEHPITLINCAEEHCASLPLFNHCGAAWKMNQRGYQVIDMISHTIEYRDKENPTLAPILPARETVPGTWCGNISFCGNLHASSLENAVDVPFWEKGSGRRFLTRNSAHALAGTSKERLSYLPMYMQQFFDTDLNKLLIYNGEKWVDTNGNEQ